MKAGKKLVSLFLAVTMIIGLVPLNSVAAKPKEPEEPKYQPVVMEEGEEWVQTTVVEDGKEYVIVAGNEDIALANDEMKVEAADVKVEDEKVTEFNENAVWTWDEKTGLFTQEDESYVKVISSILATKYNIDGLQQELKADEELGLVMLQMTQYGDTKRLVYKGKDFKTEKVDKKDISDKNSLRLFVKTTEEDRKAMEEEEVANYDDLIMTLEEPMEPLADEEYVWKQDKSGVITTGEYVIVMQKEDKALCNNAGSATNVGVNIQGDVLTFDGTDNVAAIWKVEEGQDSAHPYIIQNEGYSILQNNQVIGAGTKEVGAHALPDGTVVFYTGEKNSGSCVALDGAAFSIFNPEWWVPNRAGVRLFKKVKSTGGGEEPAVSEVTAEFYLAKDSTKFNYDAWAASDTKGANYFLPEGDDFVGSVKMSSEDLKDKDLMKPLEAFGVTATGEKWDKIRELDLFEVRSEQCNFNVNSANIGGKMNQLIYASQSAEATNYIKNSNEKDTIDKIVKRLPGATMSVTEVYEDSTTIKYIYAQTYESEIEYYVIGSDGKQHLITTATADVLGSKILVPDFNKDPMFAGFDTEIENLTGLTRDKLIGVGQELYEGDGTEPLEKNTTVRLGYEIAQANVGKDSYKMKVFYGEPMKAGNTSIQLPVQMYDFHADGMFFEYCLGGNMNLSYGYSMFGEGFGNGNGTGLVNEMLAEPEAGNPYPQYKKEVYEKVAALVNAGTMWDGTNENGNDSPITAGQLDSTIRDFIVNYKGTGGNYSDIEKALADDGIVTKEEVNNAYTAAAYMMTHFFNGDGTYGKPVDAVNALELREYKTYDGSSYYVYDAAWKSEVDGKGVIKNTVSEDKYFQSGEQWNGLDSAYYMPLDWAGMSDATLDNHDNANFLFTTVGDGAFVYEESKNLEFTFVGDDDVYLFINGHLAVDLGGAHPYEEATFRLNDKKDEFGLVDGQAATFKFYHMERHGTGSNFRMTTNINISSPSLITHKYAYDNNEELLGSGSTVEAGEYYKYAFELTNSGDNNMFNLSFWDQDLGVGLYPLNPDRAFASSYNGKFDDVLESWGDVVLEVMDKNGEHPVIKKYEFKKVEGKDGYHPILPENHDSQNPEPTSNYDYGKMERVTVAELYDRMTKVDSKTYPAIESVANKEDKYRELMEEVIRNGILVNQKIIISGFRHKLEADQEFINEVQTYGSNWKYEEIHGSDNHKIISRDVANVVKVIDYGKPVTYDFYEIFQEFNDNVKYTDVTLNIGTRENPKYEAPSLIEENDDYGAYKKTAAQVKRGDPNPADDKEESIGKGYFWKTAEDITTAKFTFVPNSFMDYYAKFGFEISANVTDEDNKVDGQSWNKYLTIYPANVVYYEDNFATELNSDVTDGIIYAGNTTAEGKDTVDEQDSDAGTQVNSNEKHNGGQQYGYDQNYAENSGAGDSNGTSVILKNEGSYPSASFTFKGTGFDILGRTSSTSTIVGYTVKDTNGTTVKYGSVDTVYVNGTLYQIPVISVPDLEYGEYTVKLTVMNSAGRNTFYLDGVRIYNPMGNQDAYLSEEKDVTIQKLNSMLLGDCKITEGGFVLPGEDGEPDENVMGTSKAEGATAMLVTYDEAPFMPLPLTYTEDMGNSDWAAGCTSSLLSVLQRGPNNEVYLDNNGSFAMVVKGNPYAVDEDGNRVGTLQIEAKLVQTAANSSAVVADSPAQMAYWGADEFVEPEEMLVKTSTAMYYNIPEEALHLIEGTKDEYVVIIRGGVSEEECNMISFSNVKSKGCEFESPITYNEENDGSLSEYFSFEDVISNEKLLEIAEYPDKVVRGANFKVKVKVAPEEYQTIYEAARLKQDFGLYTLLNSVDKKKFSYQLVTKECNEEQGVICLQGRAPTAASNYTISVEYTDETDWTEMLLFNLNVTMR